MASAKTTNNCEITADYIDTESGTTFGPANNLIASNGTTAVTVVAAPASSTQRKVSAFTFYNADTVATTVTVSIYDGTNTWRIGTWTLSAGQSLVYTPEAGWSLTSSFGLQYLTNTLTSNVDLNNTANYFDGPSVAQGTVGTWFASGVVQLQDSVGLAGFLLKLWDGTTVITSGVYVQPAAGDGNSIALSGVIKNPAGNIRISVRDASSTGGTMQYNNSGNGADCTISVLRIG